VELKVPDVQDEQALYDLINAVKAFDEPWATAYEALLKSRIEDSHELSDLFPAIERYHNHVRLSKITKGSNHTAFATLRGETAEQTASTEQTVEQTASTDAETGTEECFGRTQTSKLWLRREEKSEGKCSGPFES
jgi:hypothetical protein